MFSNSRITIKKTIISKKNYIFVVTVISAKLKNSDTFTDHRQRSSGISRVDLSGQLKRCSILCIALWADIRTSSICAQYELWRLYHPECSWAKTTLVYLSSRSSSAAIIGVVSDYGIHNIGAVFCQYRRHFKVSSTSLGEAIQLPNINITPQPWRSSERKSKN